MKSATTACCVATAIENVRALMACPGHRGHSGGYTGCNSALPPKLDPAVSSRVVEAAIEDEFFVERRLYPNVDFYSGIILKAIGIPTEMFTVIFATGRTPGWIAHWKEMVSVPYKIGRPRQLYTGSGFRDFVPISER